MTDPADIVDKNKMSGTGVVIGNKEADTISLDQIGEESDKNISRSQSSVAIPLSNRIKGISLMLLAVLCATIHGAIVKHLKHIAVGEVIFIVGIYSVFFHSVPLSFMGAPVIKFPRRIFVFSRLIVDTLAFMGKVWSLQHLPIGDANALFFTSPLFTGIIARIFIKEKLTLVHIGAMIAGLCGVILIAKPDFIFKTLSDTQPWYFYLVPVISAAVVSAAWVMQRTIGGTVSGYTVAWYTGWFQMTAGLLYHLISRDPYLMPDCHLPRVLLILVGFSVVVMSCSINLALTFEKATTAVLIRNLDTALAFIVQVALFGVAVENLSVVGAVLIMLGTICLTLSKIFDVNCGITF